MPSEENIKAKKKVRIFRRVILTLLILSISGIVISNLSFFNEDNFKRVLAKLDFGFSGKITDNSTINFTSDKGSRFAQFKGGLVMVTAEKLKVFDSTGVEFTSIQVKNQAPQVITNNKLILIYDRTGYDVRLYNSFTEVFHKKFGGRIINASINDEGYFVVISKSEGYKALVTVFNPSFEEIYKWSSAENYVTCADISPDGTKMALGVLKTVSGETYAGVEFFSLSSEKPFASKLLSGSFVYSLTYKNRDRICVLTESDYTYFKSDGEEIKKERFEAGNPIAYSNTSGVYSALAFGQTALNHNTKLVLLDNDGKEVVNSVVEGKVKSVSSGGSCFAALTDEKVYIISHTGKIIKELKASRDIFKVMSADGNHILLISSSSAYYEKY